MRTKILFFIAILLIGSVSFRLHDADPYERAVKYYNEAAKLSVHAQNELALKLLDSCLHIFPQHADARIMRIRLFTSMNMPGEACDDKQNLWKYGIELPAAISVENCPDKLRWWKHSLNDSLDIINKRLGHPLTYEEPLNMAEQMPSYPGGDEQLRQDLRSSIVYPVDCVYSNIEGTVYITITVEKDGRISGVSTARGVPGGGSLDMEAYKAMMGLKNFIPAMQNGKAVRMSMVIPVKFKLQ